MALWQITTAGSALNFTPNGVDNVPIKVDSTHFINFYAGTDTDGYAEIFAINTSTWAVSTTNTALEFDTIDAIRNFSLKIDDTHFVNLWGNINSPTYAYAQAFTINTSTWAVSTANSSLLFETQNAYPDNTAFMIDSNHFINFWSGEGSDGYVQVFAINTSTWAINTSNTRLEYDTTNGGNPACYQIDSNHFINFWAGEGNDGYAQVFTVNTSTWAVSTANSSLEFDTVNDTYNYCAKIDSNHFINFWSGEGNDGYAQVFTVNTSTWAVSTAADRIEFDTRLGWHNNCYQIDSNHFINAWEGGPSSSGMIGVFEVNTSTWIISTASDVLNYDTTVARGAAGLVSIDDKHLISFFNGGGGNYGIAQILAINENYYFNASDSGPTDANSVFTDDANAFDADYISATTCSAAGSKTSNYLEGTGTNAPITGNNISSVEIRIRGSAGISSAGTISLTAYYDTEELGTASRTGTQLASNDYSDYAALTAPTGGWTWQKINDLKARFYADSVGDDTALICIGEIRVTTTESSATTETKTTTAKTRILSTGTTKTVASKIDIKTLNNTKTITAKTRIKKINNKTITVKVRILHTQTKTATSKIRVLALINRSATSKIRIFTGGITKTVSSKIRIKTSNTETVTAKVRIITTQSKTITAKVRIKATISKTIQTKTRILVVNTKTIGTKARIASTGVTKTIQSKIDIKKIAVEKTITTKTRIKKVNTKTITTKVRVKLFNTKTITSKVRILCLVSKTINAKARIKTLNTKTITSKVRIKSTGTEKTISSKARIKTLNITKTIAAKTRIKIAQDSTITTKTRILLVTTRTITTKVDIKKFNITRTATAKARIAMTTKTILVSPADNSGSIESSVYLVWLIISNIDDKPIHANVKVDKTDDTFADLEKDLYSYADTGFEYWNGEEWTTYPDTGVTSDYYGNQARVLVSLTPGKKYWKVRGGTS